MIRQDLHPTHTHIPADCRHEFLVIRHEKPGHHRTSGSFPLLAPATGMNFSDFRHVACAPRSTRRCGLSCFANSASLFHPFTKLANGLLIYPAIHSVLSDDALPMKLSNSKQSIHLFVRKWAELGFAEVKKPDFFRDAAFVFTVFGFRRRSGSSLLHYTHFGFLCGRRARNTA